MKPEIKISSHLIKQKCLCRILIEAHSAMIRQAELRARRQHAPAAQIRLARGDADRYALQMSTRCMKVRDFEEALDIVREYVDIQII